MSKRSCEPGHRETQIRELEELKRKFCFDVYGEVEQTVVEIVAFPVSLHNVCEFRVVDVVNLMHVVKLYDSPCRNMQVRTGSRVSGVTPHRSSQVMYARPMVPSGSAASLSISTVLVLIRGRSFKILRPSLSASIVSRRRGRAGPAVKSPTAATMSTWGQASQNGRASVHGY